MRILARLPLLPMLCSVLLSSTLADSNEECKAIKKESASTRLNTHIKCDLLKRVGTVRDENYKSHVRLLMVPDILNFNEYDSNLEFIGIFAMVWKDKNLKWNSTDYDNIKMVTINTRDIWVPDVAILSAGNDDADEHGPKDTRCRLLSNGKIWCLNPGRRNIRCQTDYADWPYDRQRCTMVITSWAHSSTQMNISILGDTMIMRMLRSNGEWYYNPPVISYGERDSHYYANESSAQISIDFVLDRLQTHVRGRYIAPAIIMMIVTLTTVWLDPNSIERLSIASLNIIIHTMSMENIHWSLPHNGTTVPTLLIFYANSLVLATVALVLTFLLKNMKDTKLSTPKWLSSSTVVVLRSKIGQYLLLGMLDPKATAKIEADAEDDVESLTSAEPKGRAAWTYVTIFIGWISFFGFLLAYAIMYAVLIPSSAAKPLVETENPADRTDDQFGTAAT